DRHARPVHVDGSDHAEIDDAAAQLGILDRTEDIEDLVFGDGHRLLPGRRLGDYHYGDRYNTGVQRPPLSPTDFASLVTAMTSAFGDPTRREIYLFVHEHENGVTASAVAEHFDLHPNVARHHLDKLVAGGYLEVAVSRAPGAGAGRPSKHYRVAAPDIALDLPLRHDDVLIELLGRALGELGPERAEKLAESVGIDYGRALAGAMSPGSNRHRSFQAALHAVADALTAHGFAAHA